MALRIDAYHRRRGWAAWHPAALIRMSSDVAFPTLRQLTGEPDPGQSDAEIARNLRLVFANLENVEA